MTEYDVEFVERGDREARFLVRGITPAFANGIRRAMIADVPTFSIDEVRVIENSSVMFDEQIGLRLGLVPLTTPPGEFEMGETVTLSLDVRGPDTAYSGDIVSSDRMVQPADENVPIIDLKETQRLEVEADATLAKGRDHAKHQGGVAVGYRHLQRTEVVGDRSEFEDDDPHILRGVIEEGAAEHATDDVEDGDLVPTEAFDNERLASEKEYIFRKVDWENTQAYSVAKAGDIYVNLEGREPEGSVPEEEYKSVVRSIEQDLRDYGDPETGEKIIETVERKDEVFTGPHIDKAPDLHITLSNGYYSLGQLYGDRDQVLMTNDDEDLPFVTGIEDGAGILALSGPDIESDEQVQFGLEDFLPTLLYKFGLPVDDDFDGRVVEGLFSDEFRADNPVETESGGGSTDREDSTTDEGREKVKDRLEDLGYL